MWILISLWVVSEWLILVRMVLVRFFVLMMMIGFNVCVFECSFDCWVGVRIRVGINKGGIV